MHGGSVFISHEDKDKHGLKVFVFCWNKNTNSLAIVGLLVMGLFNINGASRSKMS
jgi:hypothetical protein